jgi:hypothetical protein
MIAFTDAQRSSAADQIQAYGASLAGIERVDAEQYADLALAAVVEEVADILRLLMDSRMVHHECEDCWYSCRLAGGCNENDGPETECTCGADKWNARLDAVLAGWAS